MAEKLYRIGDAADLLGLKTYVLRYWESEFSQLRPVRTGKGQRRYTEADMALLGRIRYLLHEQGLTIEGARRILKGASALSLAEDAPVAVSAVVPENPLSEEPQAAAAQPAPVESQPSPASRVMASPSSARC